MITDPQRILAVIEYSKMSRRALGISLGYADGAFLFHVINKRNGISTKLANKITKLYPEISYEWLLKGAGEMIFKKEAESTSNLAEKIEFLERHIKGQDARIELLEQKLATLSNTQKKK
jgi:hypothetical protein